VSDSTTVTYLITNNTVKVNSDTDTNASLDYNGNNEYVYNTSAAFGFLDKAAERRSTLLSFHHGSEDPIPPHSIIENARIRMWSNVTDNTAWNYDVSLLPDDGKWTNTEGITKWNEGQHHFNLIMSCTSGGGVIAATPFQSPANVSLNMAVHSINYQTPQRYAQVMATTSGGSPTNVAVTLARVGAFTGADATTALRITVHEANEDDTFDEVLGQHVTESAEVLCSTLSTTLSTVNFTIPSGTVVEGNKYAYIVNKNWVGARASGNYILVGASGVTTADNLYTEGSALTYGIRDSFNPVNYPIVVEMPSVTHQDGVTINEEPFGSVIRQPIVDFPTTGNEVTLSGMETLVQEWVSRDDYDPECPIGFCLGPGDATAADERVIQTHDADVTGTNTARLIVTYRRRRIHNV
jgi:hypothetical protein